VIVEHVVEPDEVRTSAPPRRRLRLEELILLLTLLVFPLDEVVAAWLRQDYTAGGDGVTLAHAFTGLLFIVCAVKALWSKDATPLRLMFSGPVPLLILCYLGASGISVLASRFPEDALGPIIQRVSMLAFYVLVLYTIRDRRTLILCIVALAASTIFQSGAALYELITHEAVIPRYELSESLVREGLQREPSGAFRVQGLAREPGLQAVQLVVIFPLLLFLVTTASRPRLRLTAGVLILLAMIAVAVSSTRSMWAGMFGTLLVFVFLAPLPHKPRIFLGSVLALVVTFAVLVVAFPDVAVRDRLFGIGGAGKFSTRQRLALAQVSWRMFERSPLIGIGTGSFMDQYQLELVDAAPVLPRRGTYASHNAYLATAAENGVLGLAVYGLMQAAVIVQLLILLRTSRDRQTLYLSAALLAAFAGFVWTLNWHGGAWGNKYGWTIIAFAGALAAIARTTTVGTEAESDRDQALPG
jgi:O-antigen ligase